MGSICLHDRVYGEVCFAEPLLVDLLRSDAVQRLQHIYQGGISAFIKPERCTTRWDHSVGVATLLRLLGADVLEQAAGLIHDVAHTAFSHVVDFVFPNHEHDYHESHREQMILGTDLPGLLARHNVDWRWLVEAGNFPLLEQPLPLLCADRLDYFLRDGLLDFAAFTAEEVSWLLSHLHVHDQQIVVDDVDAARWLGERFIELDDRCWCSVQEVGWYALMAEALRAALEHGIIVREDFRGTDAALLERLSGAGDPEVDRWLALLWRGVDFVRVDEAEAADLIALPKVRAVDPPVLIDGRAVPLSQLDAAFAAMRRAYIEDKEGTWYLRIA